MSTYRVTLQEPAQRGKPQMTATYTVVAGNPVEAGQMARRYAGIECSGWKIKRLERAV